MPATATYRLDPERGLLVVTLAGAVTAQDLEALSSGLETDPGFDRPWPTLVDATRLRIGKLKSDAVMARASVPRPNPARVAIVAPSDPVFGLSRMFQMMTEGHGNVVEVFRGMDEAVEWLGV